jgi:signal transduction histidine kinase
LYVLPFPDEAGDRNAALFLGSLDRRLVAVTVVVGAMALLITWTVARGLVRPLSELSAATSDLARGNLATRVAPRGGREVVELGRAFNAMAVELDRQQALRRNLVHDVAHELRTPLTALRCRLETVIDGLSPDPGAAMRDLCEEVLHLGRLVDDLQELALAEARELRLDIDEVDLAPVVESAIRAAGLEGDARLRSEVVAGTLVRGDEGRLRQVVLNLLTNAERYTPASGSIVVRAASGGPAAGQAQPEPLVGIEVRNSGSRLTTDDLSRVFDRFYRADPSRERGSGGTGLGLAIVKHLIEAQGGRVWARSDEDGVTVGFGVPRGRSTTEAPVA